MDGLLVGLNSGIEAGIRGFYDAEDRKYRRMETEAKLKSQEENQKRQAMLDQMDLEKNSPERRRESMAFDLAKTGQQGEFDEQGNFLGAQYRPDYIALKQRLARASAANLARSGGVSLTPGQKKADESFGKEYTNFNLLGGYAGLQKNISETKKIMNEMGGYEDDPKTGEKVFKVKNDNISGPLAGLGWKGMRNITNPQGSDIEDRIRGLLMQSLKQVVGGNPTEGEREELVRSGFNSSLSEQQNYDRINAMLEDFERRGKAKNQSAKYYENQGTLQGFNASDMMNEGNAVANPSPNVPGLLQKREGLLNSPQGLIQPKAEAATPMSKEDQEALNWARSNPKDPRAKQILQMHGM